MGFWPFINFIDTIINGGVSAQYWGCTGVGGYPSSQMWGILHMFRVMPKTHLSGLWPNYLLFWPFYYVGLFIALVLFKNYVETIMFRIDAVLRWGNLLRHNAHKAAIILVIAYFLYICWVINVIFSCFTAVVMGWTKFGTSIDFGSHVCKFYVIYPNWNIYILTKWFDFVFLFIPSLCWQRGTGLWVIQCVSVDYSPECYQNESIPNSFYSIWLYIQ